MSVSFLLELVALVCLILAAIGVPATRISLGWLGMALWLAALMTGGAFLR